MEIIDSISFIIERLRRGYVPLLSIFLPLTKAFATKLVNYLLATTYNIFALKRSKNRKHNYQNNLTLSLVIYIYGALIRKLSIVKIDLPNTLQMSIRDWSY